MPKSKNRKKGYYKKRKKKPLSYTQKLRAAAKMSLSSPVALKRGRQPLGASNLLALADVPTDEGVGISVRGQAHFVDKLFMALDYPDGSNQVQALKDEIDELENGIYGLACADGTYLILQAKDESVQRFFFGGVVLVNDPRNITEQEFRQRLSQDCSYCGGDGQ